MDKQLISNWNKRLNSESIIFHLGDFGNFDVLPLLNFGTMFFVTGNYERDDKAFSEGLINDDRVKVKKPFTVKIKGVPYSLCHEPIENNDFTQNDFCLFGHIHRLQMVKRNGINVGTDANRFTPMSINELTFLHGGVINHFDDNVFSEHCGGK